MVRMSTFTGQGDFPEFNVLGEAVGLYYNNLHTNYFLSIFISWLYEFDYVF